VGQGAQMTISNAVGSGTITVTSSGVSRVGGLVGDYGWGSSMTLSHASVNITYTGVPADAVGGLVGTGTSPITKCYATGDVAGANNVGGLVGYVENNADNFQLSESYATGNVTATVSTAGGLIGKFLGYNWSGLSAGIQRNYAVGAVTAPANKGGLVGSDDNLSGGNFAAYTANYWNNTVNSGYTGVGAGPTPAGISGASTAAMQAVPTSIYSGWDFSTVWQQTNGAYPTLR
jgi:hypothetical protein